MRIVCTNENLKWFCLVTKLDNNLSTWMKWDWCTIKCCTPTEWICVCVCVCVHCSPFTLYSLFETVQALTANKWGKAAWVYQTIEHTHTSIDGCIRAIELKSAKFSLAFSRCHQPFFVSGSVTFSISFLAQVYVEFQEFLSVRWMQKEQDTRHC